MQKNNSFLLAIAIGPVHEFIVASRRTRDLWLGSRLLSDVSAATAKYLSDLGAELIFPHPQQISHLNQPELAGDNDDAIVSAGKVANVVLVRLSGELEPKQTAAAAKRAANLYWQATAGKLLEDRSFEHKINLRLWRQQVSELLECYAIWVPLAEDYQASRKRLMLLLQYGRKSCRDFVQLSDACLAENHGIPKSSLDGRRESVLQRAKNKPLECGVVSSRDLPLTEGEELDCAGVVKRAALGYQYYPSVSRVAADLWLRKLKHASHLKDEFRFLVETCAELAYDNLLSEVKHHEPYGFFPYDGAAIFVSRHRSMAKELNVEEKVFGELKDIVNKICSGPAGLGQPDPYLAIIAADGDQMGKAIAQTATVEQHREFSKHLASFASSVEGIVNSHQGVSVYAGGDDVLAFLPLDKALECARALREAFVTWPSLQGLTLSAGVAIGHCMEPLEDLLNYARKAEKLAKKGKPGQGQQQVVGRNGLAIYVQPRSGPGVMVCEQWQASERSIDRRVQQWAKYFSEKKLPAKLPYDLRQLALELGEEASTTAVQKSTLLLLKRKQVDEGLREELVLKLACIVSAWDLKGLADEMLVALKLAPVLNAYTIEGSKQEASQ